MARYLLAALCALLIAAAPTTQQVRYASPERILAAVPNNLMPVPGKSWDEFADDRVSEWLKDHAVGAVVNDAPPPRTKIEPYHPSKQSTDQQKRFVASYQYRVTSHKQEFTVSATVFISADQEPIIANLRDGEKVRLSGVISEAKVTGRREPMLSLMVNDAKIISKD